MSQAVLYLKFYKTASKRKIDEKNDKYITEKKMAKITSILNF